ncbi:TetR/AcrR family transcriptional regulator [Jatrophihabitans telluris]|uniref:TetR/AcrR family transcriptional regulator n=1 Tax=Jatrophihabitans telluris TaxID=2038343 RepID=A0ABY4R1E9_9ACTN|nr:ScbR family autoregulator-binding transcription factor [Jatrophihabitans telluris]UQX89624.1 TetR/AcrR family transcriptional regulator [Jatrophihabitans telluris]
MQLRAEQTRHRVLQAASEVFSRRGYAAAGMVEIIEAAGVTKGALYFHFPSKEALAVAIVEEQTSHWPDLIARLETAAPDPLIAIVALTHEVGRQFREDPIVRAGVRLSTEGESIDAELPTPFVTWTRAVHDLLAQARRQGLLRQGVTPGPTARTIVSGFFGVQHVSQLQTERRDLDTRLDEFWKVVLAGISVDSDVARIQREAKRAGDRLRHARR